jgi:mannose-6-phosphate isomerase-like protein (cupin superfamily)
MKGYHKNIEAATVENEDFRRVLYTAPHSQLVLMSLKPGEEIGAEIHEESDQFFRFEEGSGKVMIDGNHYEVTDGDVIIVPAGAHHNVINSSESDPLKMYTLYSPPHHKDGTIHNTKAEAEASDEEYDDIPTES